MRRVTTGLERSTASAHLLAHAEQQRVEDGKLAAAPPHDAPDGEQRRLPLGAELVAILALKVDLDLHLQRGLAEGLEVDAEVAVGVDRRVADEQLLRTGRGSQGGAGRSSTLQQLLRTGPGRRRRAASVLGAG